MLIQMQIGSQHNRLSALTKVALKQTLTAPESHVTTTSHINITQHNNNNTSKYNICHKI